ncbi:MAG: hypothetical protein ABFS10_10625, partial [Bacteroidota bacterium]
EMNLFKRAVFVYVMVLFALQGYSQSIDFTGQPVDGRLCFGNGYVLGCFTGPFELPEEPAYKVHDKISRLWLGYSSSPSIGVGLQPVITNKKTGEHWMVRGVDEYRYDNGVIIMETTLPVGKVITETYGLWQKPVLIRRIRFIAGEGNASDYTISTVASLYKEHSNKPPADGDEEAMRLYNVYKFDERERPVTHLFPEQEVLTYNAESKSVLWEYQDERYRKVIIKSAESLAKTSVTQKTKDNCGSVRFENSCNKTGGELTVVLAFAGTMDEAEMVMKECDANTLDLKRTQKSWQEWFDSGAVVSTGNEKLDNAYKNQLMYAKVAIDEELGGHLVGGRYQMPTMWGRDAGIVMSVLLDAGHYEDVKKILWFFPDHMNWNTRNNCMHANFHISGRVIESYSSPGQVPVEDIVQPGEWTNQMGGPQLDAMSYYLYNAAKLYRYTRDKAFMKELWPFVVKVGDALAEDSELVYERGIPSDYYGEDERFQKYNPETGLIVDNCWESDILGEYSLMNFMSVVGFSQAYTLSVEMGDEKPLWKQRALELDKAANRHLIKYDSTGNPYILKNVPREWMQDWHYKPTNGEEEAINNFGYAWSFAATIPYFNYTNETFRKAYRKQVDPTGDADGWGMWWATTAHAAFEADLPEVGWNYLSKYLAQLPISLQAYEHNSDVEGIDGTKQRATLNLFSFAYLPHAVIRGMSGFGYNEHTDSWYFRPQIPEEIGKVQSTIRIGNTWFDVESEGNGDRLKEFAIDGEEQIHTGGILDIKFLDGQRHSVVVKTGS